MRRSRRRLKWRPHDAEICRVVELGYRWRWPSSRTHPTAPPDLAVQPGTIRGIPSVRLLDPGGLGGGGGADALAVVHAAEAGRRVLAEPARSATTGSGPRSTCRRPPRPPGPRCFSQSADTAHHVRANGEVRRERRCTVRREADRRRNRSARSPSSTRSCIAPKAHGATTVDLFQLIATSLDDPAESPVPPVPRDHRFVPLPLRPRSPGRLCTLRTASPGVSAKEVTPVNLRRAGSARYREDSWSSATDQARPGRVLP